MATADCVASSADRGRDFVNQADRAAFAMSTPRFRACLHILCQRTVLSCMSRPDSRLNEVMHPCERPIAFRVVQRPIDNHDATETLALMALLRPIAQFVGCTDAINTMAHLSCTDLVETLRLDSTPQDYTLLGGRRQLEVALSVAVAGSALGVLTTFSSARIVRCTIDHRMPCTTDIRDCRHRQTTLEARTESDQKKRGQCVESVSGGVVVIKRGKRSL